MNEIIRAIEMEQLRTDIPKFSIGDTVRVQVKVVEGNRERLQAFEGTVIARRNGSCRETFTVRRVSYGIGVERTFPIHSPRVDSITAASARPPRSRTAPSKTGSKKAASAPDAAFFAASLAEKNRSVYSSREK